MKTWKAIGLMSGSSLDGLDVAYVEFRKEQKQWHYNLKIGETFKYSNKWQSILQNIRNYNSNKILAFHTEYARLLGEYTNRFIAKYNFNPDLIASHGHTVFHNPNKGYSFQLGDGRELSKATNLTTVTDFRTTDIKLGGQGAPLVPIGDELLFPEFIGCINLGGIANISFKKNNKRVAFDICPANQLLNYLANKKGLNYDKDGTLASKGNILKNLYQTLTEEPYYYHPYPKSLSNEYITTHFIPLIEQSKGTVVDKLHTAVLHIADQIYKTTLFFEKHDDIYKSLNTKEAANNREKILFTGGGTYNRFLLSKLENIVPYTLTVPDSILIDYKEALIFALMGVLKINDEINCFASATGASEDSSAGTIFQP